MTSFLVIVKAVLLGAGEVIKLIQFAIDLVSRFMASWFFWLISAASLVKMKARVADTIPMPATAAMMPTKIRETITSMSVKPRLDAVLGFDFICSFLHVTGMDLR